MGNAIPSWDDDMTIGGIPIGEADRTADQHCDPHGLRVFHFSVSAAPQLSAPGTAEAPALAKRLAELDAELAAAKALEAARVAPLVEEIRFINEICYDRYAEDLRRWEAVFGLRPDQAP